MFKSGYTEKSIIHHGRVDDGVHLTYKTFKGKHFAMKVFKALGSTSAEVPQAVDQVALRPVMGARL